MQIVTDILTKPFVGAIDMLSQLLKFVREKLRPNDKPIQDALQQAQDMLNQAMDNALNQQKHNTNGPIANVNSAENSLLSAVPT